ILERPSNRREVPTDALDEAEQIGQVGLLGVLEPWLQSRSLALAYDLPKSRQGVLHREQIGTALVALLEEGSFSTGQVAGLFVAPPAEATSRDGPLPWGQHRGSEHWMRGRTPCATALGAPLRQVASKIVKGSSKALCPNRFPPHPHILLSGFPPFPQIGHIPVDCAGALSGSTAGNRLGPLVANHGTSSTAEEARNFGLR